MSGNLADLNREGGRRMSSGSRVEGVRERAVALLRLGRLALAFLKIAFEQFDEVQNRWRFPVDCRHHFLGLVFAVAPHNTPFLCYLHITPELWNGLICGPANAVADENKAVTPYPISVFAISRAAT